MKYLLILIIIMITSTCLFSEVIVLNNGKIIRGEILNQNDNEISVKTNNDEIKIAKIEVNKIYFSDKAYDDSLQIKKLTIKFLFGSFFLSGFSNLTIFFGAILPNSSNAVLVISSIAFSMSTLAINGIPYFGASVTGTTYLIAGIFLISWLPDYFFALSISMFVTSAFQFIAFIIQVSAKYFAKKYFEKIQDKISLILYPNITFDKISNTSLTAGLSIKI